MIVYNYTPVEHYFYYLLDRRCETLLTPPGKGIDMVDFPEAGLALIKHNERFK